jgi:MFS family permease
MKNYSFKLMITGQIISLFGASILRFALSIYILEKTGRADIFATILAVSIIPGIILMPIGGAFADLYNKKKLMVIYDSISSIIILCLLILMIKGLLTIFMIGVIITLLSSIAALYYPLAQSSIPFLVNTDEIKKANGIAGGVGALSQIAGPIIGGVLLTFLKIDFIILFSMIAFMASAVIETWIHMNHISIQINDIFKKILDDLKDGFDYVTKGNTYLLKLLVTGALLNLILTPFFIIGTPFILKSTLKLNDFLFGISIGSIQIASILGAISLSFKSSTLKMTNLYRQMMRVGLLTIPVAFSVLPLSLHIGKHFTYIIFMIFI